MGPNILASLYMMSDIIVNEKKKRFLEGFRFGAPVPHKQHMHLHPCAFQVLLIVDPCDFLFHMILGIQLYLVDVITFSKKKKKK